MKAIRKPRPSCSVESGITYLQGLTRGPRERLSKSPSPAARRVVRLE